MISAYNFINEEIEQLVAKFNNIKASISYDKFACAFYVKIEPKIFLRESKALKSAQLEIMSRFYSNNFSDTILFVAKDSLLDLKDSYIEFSGKSYICVERLLAFAGNMNKFNNEVTTIDSDYLASMGENNYALAA